MRKLSLVVPVLDDAGALAHNLPLLSRLRSRGHELIVVDGGSRDGSADVGRLYADQILPSPRGRAVQMNVGAAAAQGDALLFVHADCALPEDADAIVDAALEKAAWGRFDVRLVGRSPWLPWIARTMNLRSRLTGIATGDQALFVRRDVFEATGGFAPLPLMEDVELCKRILEDVGRPACVRERVDVSGRRWDRDGALCTVLSMASLRVDWWRGFDAAELHERYYGRSPARKPALLVFAKPIVPGRVKTRLAAEIGTQAAAEVYARLVRRTLDTAVRARRAGVVSRVELWVDPEGEPGVLGEWAHAHRIEVHAQQGADLGARMHHALATSLAHGTPAMVVGTDVPGYDVPYLAAAVAALQRHDAVVGPAEDGGYVLLGLARDLDVFSGIAWSTPGVLAATRAKLRALQASSSDLASLWDVDTVDDLRRLQAQFGS